MAIFSACRSAPAVRPLQLVDYTYFARSPGIQYGGHINISHLAVYGPTTATAAPPFAVFDFGASGARQATIVERQNMQSVSIRCMIVVKVPVLFSVCVRGVCYDVRAIFGGDADQVLISRVRSFRHSGGAAAAERRPNHLVRFRRWHAGMSACVRENRV